MSRAVLLDLLTKPRLSRQNPKTIAIAAGWNCQKALTVTNNIAISATACSYKPTDGAVNIAHQIAAKVAKQ
jgi:hypothetical protein